MKCHETQRQQVAEDLLGEVIVVEARVRTLSDRLDAQIDRIDAAEARTPLPSALYLVVAFLAGGLSVLICLSMLGGPLS